MLEPLSLRSSAKSHSLSHDVSAATLAACLVLGSSKALVKRSCMQVVVLSDLSHLKGGYFSSQYLLSKGTHTHVGFQEFTTLNELYGLVILEQGG